MPSQDGTQSRVVYIVRIDALGDCLISLPAIRALYEYYHSAEGGSCKVIFLMNKTNAELFKHCPWKDEIITLPSQSSFRGNLAFYSSLAARHPVAVFNLASFTRPADYLSCLCGTTNTYGITLVPPPKNSPSASFLGKRFARTWKHAYKTHGLLCGIPYYISYHLTQGTKMRIAMASFMSLKPLMKHCVRGELMGSDIENQMRMVESATGVPQTMKPLPDMSWLCTPGQNPPASPYFIYGVGASMAKKNLPLKRAAELLGILHKQFPELTIVFIGTAKESHLAEEILQFVPEKESFPYLNLCGKTSLGELADVIKNAQFMIGCDTGPTHLAGNLGIPLFVIMNWAQMGVFFPNPYYRQAHYILSAPRDCAYCNWMCPYMTDGICNCIAEIQPEAAAQTIKETLDSTKA